MLLVGVTGGIGSGKSLVCQILEKLGIPVYYADQEARRLMNTDEGLVLGVKELLGEEAYREGELDRKHVASLVFGRPDLLLELNELVHPAVRSDFRKWAGRQKGVPYVVEEAALLFESGSAEEFDLIVVVDAPEELRIRRVSDRDGITGEQVRRRMSGQMPPEEKRERADEVVINDGERMLLPQVVALHEKLINCK